MGCNDDSCSLQSEVTIPVTAGSCFKIRVGGSEGGIEVGPGTLSISCVATTCGDSILDSDEDCDDGNANNTDSCHNDCSDNICGDGVICDDAATCTSGPTGGTEECDDGRQCEDGTDCTENFFVCVLAETDPCVTRDGDGCSEVCEIEQ